MSAFLNDTGLYSALQAGDISLTYKCLSTDKYVKVRSSKPNKSVKKNQIQPSSLDLRIGLIYRPPLTEDHPVYSETGVSLKPGETVVVETLEKIKLSNAYGSFGFPPAGLSQNSILMTNPGHIDPGYEGHLQFTLINMGRKDYVLSHNAVIVSLLVFKVDEAAVGYKQLNGELESGPRPGVMQRLAPDFADFNGNVRQIVDKAVDDKVRWQEVWVKFLAPILVGVIAALSAGVSTHYVGTYDLKERVSRLESLGRFDDLIAKVDDLEKRLSK